MRNNPFATLRASKRDIVKSYSWYMQQVKRLATARLRPSALLKSDIGVLTNRLTIGRMYMFFYDPKTKEKLPVWDRFPLVIPINKTPDGFLGLNLHYLPYLLRAQLLGSLYKLSVEKDNKHPNTRLRLSWDILSNFAKYPGVQSCVKRYLKGHIRSNFLEIHPIDWRAAIFLPIEDFQKMSRDQVFRKTRSEL